MLEYVRKDLEKKGLDIEVIITDDYNLPNRALAEGEVDANFFQHLPFLEKQIAEYHYKIISVAKIEFEPMGIYSKKIQKLPSLPRGGSVAIPNDPTNESRALKLLEKGGLIQLSHRSSYETVLDIVYNPKDLQFLEIDAAILPRSLSDVDLAVINANYALQAGLDPEKNALLLEGKNSPYANVLVVRKEEAQSAAVKLLIEELTSEKMKAFLLKCYRGAVLPAS